MNKLNVMWFVRSISAVGNRQQL